MPMSRTWAGSLSMRLAPKRISPPSSSLKPAIIMPLTSARFLQRVLDLLHGLDARGRPLLFVVVHELDRRERRQAARQLRKVEVAARRAAERRLQDHLAHG